MDLSDYRGIALMNTLFNLLSKVISLGLEDACEVRNLARREQVGFMRSEECLARWWSA